jgi:hypothetical protein
MNTPVQAVPVERGGVRSSQLPATLRQNDCDAAACTAASLAVAGCFAGTSVAAGVACAGLIATAVVACRGCDIDLNRLRLPGGRGGPNPYI